MVKQFYRFYGSRNKLEKASDELSMMGFKGILGATFIEVFTEGEIAGNIARKYDLKLQLRPLRHW